MNDFNTFTQLLTDHRTNLNKTLMEWSFDGFKNYLHFPDKLPSMAAILAFKNFINFSDKTESIKS